jgi:hypothetical protein
MISSNSLQTLRRLFLILIALLAAAVGPNIFPAAQAGHGSLAVFATDLLLPAVLILAIVYAVSRKWHADVARSILWGAIAGALATIPLEAIRIPGFLLGSCRETFPA